MWGAGGGGGVTLRKGGAMFRRRRTRRFRNHRAFAPRVQPMASRRWSRSGRECLGASAASRPAWRRGLKLRHDHGSNYMSGDFQSEIECLGIEASPSFVREPEGNGVAKRFIRTLKENLLWVRTFKTTRDSAPSSSRRQALQ